MATPWRTRWRARARWSCSRTVWATAGTPTGSSPPALAAQGYRVANVDLRSCGDSSLGWDGYTRTDIAGDLLAVVRHLGGPAVIIGHSISGGAATIAAATAPELIRGAVELAPFTRKQSVDLSGLVRHKRFSAGYLQMAKVIIGGKLSARTRYLDVAMPVKPVDWDAELDRITTKLTEPGRMKVVQTMAESNPGDAGSQLGNLTCPVLVVEGSLDPDWASPRAEGERILADVPPGIGGLVVIDGSGHYPHAQKPDEVMALAAPFLEKNLPRA